MKGENMLEVKTDPATLPAERRHNPVPHQNFPEVSIRALIIRFIPLTLSFLLFILAASTDVNKWGSGAIQALLVMALLLGIMGLVVFIPKRVK
jgi:nitroreductase